MASYFVCSAATGTNSGASWLNAHVSIPGCMTAQALVGGDIIYVHNTHNYLAGATITWTLPESGAGQVFIYCVDGGDAAFTALGAAMGSTVGSLMTGASESTNANNAFNVNGSFFCHGMQFKTANGGSSDSADLNIATSSVAAKQIFQACSFWVSSTNISATIVIGSTGTMPGEEIKFLNCSFKFGSVNQTIDLRNGIIDFINCTQISSYPTTLLNPSISTARCTVHLSGCDFSYSSNLILITAGKSANEFYGNNCTIATPTTGGPFVLGQGIIELHACAAVDGTNGANVLAFYRNVAEGIVQDDQTVYVTSSPGQGTQDDGTVTSYSMKLTPTSLVSSSIPLYTPWGYRKIAATGSKTLTVKCADTEGALLKDRELFLEVEYMGGSAPANSPQSALEGTWPLSGVYADFTTAGSSLTDTGEAWTGLSETGTYTLSKTITLDEQGYVRWRVGLGLHTTNPVYIDPFLTVA